MVTYIISMDFSNDNAFGHAVVGVIAENYTQASILALKQIDGGHHPEITAKLKPLGDEPSVLFTDIFEAL